MLEKITMPYENFKLLHSKQDFVIGYDDEGKVVMISRQDGARIYYEIPDFPYYFCVRKADVKANRPIFRLLRERKKIRGYEQDGDFVKIFCGTTVRKNRNDDKEDIVRYLKSSGIDSYEADLTPYQRLVVDLKIKVASEYRTLYFDIETDDRGKGIVIGARRIVSIAAVDDEGHTFYWTGKDEREIIEKFFRKIVHYDLITGWNSEKFDIPYIKERAKKLKMPWFQWRQIVQVDMMQKLMEIHKRNIELIKEVRSFSLKAVSEHFLAGETKLAHTETIWEMFTKNPEKLKEYNIQDCILLKKLEDKLKIIGQKIAEHLVSQCFLNEFAVSRILDTYILKSAVGSGVRFKSKPPREDNDFDPNKKAGYVGGLVLDPVQGIHYNVLHFDFTSLYPSIIQTFNISPETWRRAEELNEDKDPKYIYTPNKQVFSREQGIIPKVITGLLDARNEIRNGLLKTLKEGSKEYEIAYFKQYAFKTISNSFYGILGASFTRYYRKETAEAITLSGHYMLHLVEQWCEAKDIQVLYGDTDSVFVKSRHSIDALTIHEQINSFIAFHLFKHFGIRDSHMDLKVEAVYESFLLLGKKKYVKNEEGHLKIVGLEARRRETLPFSAKKQTELLELLMLKKATAKEIQQWVRDLKEYVLDGEMTKEEVTLQIKLSKHVDEYQKKKKNKKTKEVELDENGKEILLPSVLAHIKVANYLKDNGIKENGLNTWEKGCYVKYIITNQTPKLEAKSVYQLEEGEYDRNYYWDVKVFAMMQRVLEVAIPEVDWSEYLIKQKRTKRK